MSTGPRSGQLHGAAPGWGWVPSQAVERTVTVTDRSRLPRQRMSPPAPTRARPRRRPVDGGGRRHPSRPGHLRRRSRPRHPPRILQTRRRTLCSTRPPPAGGRSANTKNSASPGTSS